MKHKSSTLLLIAAVAALASACVSRATPSALTPRPASTFTRTASLVPTSTFTSNSTPTSTTRTSTPTTTDTSMPTATSTLTPMPTDTPSPTVTDTPVPTPTDTPIFMPTLTSTPIPTPISRLVADFNSCTGTNNLGGAMGAAYNAPDSLSETYVDEAERGCVARLEYHVQEWSAFWMKLQGVDLTPYSQLVLDVKADPAVGIPGQMKVELKRAGNQEVSIVYVSGITVDWHTMSVDLADLGPTGYTAPLSSFAGMEELVFVFEASKSGAHGVVYLDDLFFRR